MPLENDPLARLAGLLDEKIVMSPEQAYERTLAKKGKKKKRYASRRPPGRPKGKNSGKSGKGYSYIYDDNGKYVTEQRYLMQKKLGRELLPHEAVFFVDGDRTNLDPGNLRLGPKPGYKGEVICPHCSGKVF